MKLKQIVLLAVAMLYVMQLLAQPLRHPVKRRPQKKHAPRHYTRAGKVCNPYGKHTL
ncbi:hypothetical protein FHS10_002977 [Mucilaginibacter dorajii]|uniref:hypothetical protein n=1 Tax=Mucilaginibacter dorajii TaxID=692994 RepID=UPI00216703DE|nr:hypothetical protein [Mucilaginibacter dorajii]MCS3735025.1 hypothetical protein [Mucilaginibacter dorajii]